MIEKVRNARAIVDKEIEDFVRARDLSLLYQEPHAGEFPAEYRRWIQASRLNRFSGLSEAVFPHASYVHGTSQAFDFFYREHFSKRFRFFRGEFAYHKIFARHSLQVAALEEDELRAGDALIVSLPFSDSGALPDGMAATLDTCERLQVPVLIDAAYVGMSTGLEFDFSHPAIHTVTTSLSKTFHGAAYARIGVRFQRKHIDDPVDFFNDVGMFNRVGWHLGLDLMRRFSVDFIAEKYRSTQLAICKELDVEPSACVIFGLARATDERFKALNRGRDTHRLCVSRLIAERHGVL